MLRTKISGSISPFFIKVAVNHTYVIIWRIITIRSVAKLQTHSHYPDYPTNT
ncbi:MAG: hypothetical protein H7X77_08155 [Anaerolineae bacterium]|nr:hypothetical protein [Anaerolineae bacterium]